MAMELKTILVVNGGSSSYKCALFEGDHPQPIWEEGCEWSSPDQAGQGLEELLKRLPDTQIDAIGHRIVHGGETFHALTPITKKVKEQIEALSYLAPLHNPLNLAGIEACEQLFPTIPQYALFDTGFHQTLPEVNYTYPIPLKWRDKGIRRYGFHGISHAYCSDRAAHFLKNRELKVVICHLGAGASLCAVDKGKSIDTTMGMTPLEGLMMGSRSGSIDPGILLHLERHEKLSCTAIDHLLNKESGLLGVSEISEDLQAILDAAEKGNPQARLAVDLFIHRLTTSIGMMIASLKGIDALVFTAGIGENAPLIRERACETFAFLGLELDKKKNGASSHQERAISLPSSSVRVLVIPTNEAWEIARSIRRSDPNIPTF